MLARTLRLSLSFQLLLAAIVAWLLVKAGLAWWLAVPLALLLPFAFTALVLGVEFLTGATLDRRPGRRLGPRAAFRLWRRESCTSFLFFTWKQPFASEFPEPPLVRDPQRPAVLLVHGYMCNRAVWEPLLASGRLRECNVATVNLEPVFGPIEQYADVLERAIDRLRAATGAPRVTLVCHSMGGLAARAYLHAHGDDAVERVVTIATPHDGTLFGAFGSGHNARQMRKGTAYLRGLIGAEPEGRAARFVCIASVDDNLIIPRASPLLAGARHVTLEGIGHLALLVDPRLWDVLRELLVPAAPQRDMSSAM
jgi:predicted alpha/beta hydrolase family esterase